MSINYDQIGPQGTRVTVNYPRHGGTALGHTLARHSGYEPTYKVRLDSGVTAWYPASWLARTDDPDRMVGVAR